MIGTTSDGRLRIGFSRAAVRTELDYAVEVSDDLSAGGWTAIATSKGGTPFRGLGGATASEADGGSVKLVTIQDAAPTGASRRFARVRVAAP